MTIDILLGEMSTFYGILITPVMKDQFCSQGHWNFTKIYIQKNHDYPLKYCPEDTNWGRTT